MLQYVAVCCSMLQCGVAWCEQKKVRRSVLMCVAVCCSAIQCDVAVDIVCVAADILCVAVDIVHSMSDVGGKMCCSVLQQGGGGK